MSNSLVQERLKEKENSHTSLLEGALEFPPLAVNMVYWIISVGF
jgi:hypothetical protein